MLIIDVPGLTTATSNPIIDVTPGEQAIADIAQVAQNSAWWNADPSYFNTTLPVTWYDCLNSYAAVAKFPSNAPAVLESAMAGQPDVKFGATGTASNNGQLASQTGFEIGFAGAKDYTLACVLQVAPSAPNMYPLGSGNDSGGNGAIMVNANGSLRVLHQGTLIATTTDKDYRDGAPHFVVASYDYAAKQMALRVDGVQKALVNSVSTEVAVNAQNQRLCIGGTGATTNMASAFVGQIGDVFSFTGVALHKAAYATQLAALEARRSKYGIA